MEGSSGRKFKSCITEIPTLTFFVAVYSASHDPQNIGTLLYCFDVRQFRKLDDRRRMTLGIRRRRTGCIETRHIESYSLNHAFCAKEEILIMTAHFFICLMLPARAKLLRSLKVMVRSPSRLSIELGYARESQIHSSNFC